MQTLAKKHLFWDVNLSELNPVKHKKFIVERILNLGDIDDFNWALKQYGQNELKLAVNLKRLNNKSRNFWRLYFQLNDD